MKCGPLLNPFLKCLIGTPVNSPSLILHMGSIFVAKATQSFIFARGNQY